MVAITFSHVQAWLFTIICPTNILITYASHWGQAMCFFSFSDIIKMGNLVGNRNGFIDELIDHYTLSKYPPHFLIFEEIWLHIYQLICINSYLCCVQDLGGLRKWNLCTTHLRLTYFSSRGLYSVWYVFDVTSIRVEKSGHERLCFAGSESERWPWYFSCPKQDYPIFHPRTACIHPSRQCLRLLGFRITWLAMAVWSQSIPTTD